MARNDADMKLWVRALEKDAIRNNVSSLCESIDLSKLETTPGKPTSKPIHPNVAKITEKRDYYMKRSLPPTPISSIASDDEGFENYDCIYIDADDVYDDIALDDEDYDDGEIYHDIDETIVKPKKVNVTIPRTRSISIGGLLSDGKSGSNVLCNSLDGINKVVDDDTVIDDEVFYNDNPTDSELSDVNSEFDRIYNAISEENYEIPTPGELDEVGEEITSLDKTKSLPLPTSPSKHERSIIQETIRRLNSQLHLKKAPHLPPKPGYHRTPPVPPPKPNIKLDLTADTPALPRRREDNSNFFVPMPFHLTTANDDDSKLGDGKKDSEVYDSSGNVYEMIDEENQTDGK